MSWSSKLLLKMFKQC